MTDLIQLHILTTEQACRQLVDMVQELRIRKASVERQKADIKTFLKYYRHYSVPWKRSLYGFLICSFLLCGCSWTRLGTPDFNYGPQTNAIGQVWWPPKPSPTSVLDRYEQHGLYYVPGTNIPGSLRSK